ncbi:MAG TPA: hypothetical protein VFO85_06795 [Vicinamibacteria bacterium]|nr:hypothetical protein [Vicinamibacteria bacterium]
MSRTRLRPRAARPGPGRWVLYYLGRVLQVTGLLVTLVAATAFFGTPDTLAMLRMMLVGVLLFIPGWLLVRRDPAGR